MPDPKIRTLIVTGMTDVHHDWRTTTPALKDLLDAMVRTMFDEWVATGRARRAEVSPR